MSCRSGRLLFTVSVHLSTGDLTVWPVGAAGRLRPLSQPRLVLEQMWSRTEGSGSRRFRLCAIQTRSYYAQGKSCSFFYSFRVCVGEEGGEC